MQLESRQRQFNLNPVGVCDRTQTYAVGVDGVIQNQDESVPEGKERFKCLDAVSSVNVLGTKYVKNW